MDTIKLLIAVALVIVAECNQKLEIPVTVSRRSGGDSYVLTNNSSPMLCNEGNNLTYLVSERQCVNNEELLRGMNY